MILSGRSPECCHHFWDPRVQIHGIQKNNPADAKLVILLLKLQKQIRVVALVKTNLSFLRGRLQGHLKGELTFY